MNRFLQTALTRTTKLILPLDLHSTQLTPKRHCGQNVSSIDDRSIREYHTLGVENSVYLTKSTIYNIGIFAVRQFETDQMVIEYTGEVLESNLRNVIENQYNKLNRNVYTIR